APGNDRGPVPQVRGLRPYQAVPRLGLPVRVPGSAQAARPHGARPAPPGAAPDRGTGQGARAAAADAPGPLAGAGVLPGAAAARRPGFDPQALPGQAAGGPAGSAVRAEP